RSPRRGAATTETRSTSPSRSRSRSTARTSQTSSSDRPTTATAGTARDTPATLASRADTNPRLPAQEKGTKHDQETVRGDLGARTASDLEGPDRSQTRQPRRQNVRTRPAIRSAPCYREADRR